MIHGSGELMKEMDRRLKVIDEVIRHIVVRVDEEQSVVERARTRRSTTTARRRVARGLPPTRQEGEGRRGAKDEGRDDDRFDEAGVKNGNAEEVRRTGRGKAAARGADKDKGQRRGLFRRRKVCKFCADKIDDINYKDVKLLQPFVPERAKVLPRRISGTCAHAPAEAPHRAIMRARAIALLAVHGRVAAKEEPVHGRSFFGNTSRTSGAAATSSRWPTATRATTCCRASSR